MFKIIYSAIFDDEYKVSSLTIRRESFPEIEVILQQINEHNDNKASNIIVKKVIEISNKNNNFKNR